MNQYQNAAQVSNIENLLFFISFFACFIPILRSAGFSAITTAKLAVKSCDRLSWHPELNGGINFALVNTWIRRHISLRAKTRETWTFFNYVIKKNRYSNKTMFSIHAQASKTVSQELSSTQLNGCSGNAFDAAYSKRVVYCVPNQKYFARLLPLKSQF